MNAPKLISAHPSQVSTAITGSRPLSTIRPRPLRAQPARQLGSVVVPVEGVHPTAGATVAPRLDASQSNERPLTVSNQPVAGARARGCGKLLTLVVLPLTIAACGTVSPARTITQTMTITRTVTVTRTVRPPAAKPATANTVRGNGSENLGTITVSSPSTLEWSCTCGVFSIVSGLSGTHAIAIDSQASSGQSAVDPGSYPDAQVQSDGTWTVRIVPG